MRRVLTVAALVLVTAGAGYCAAVYGLGMDPADVLRGMTAGVAAGRQG